MLADDTKIFREIKIKVGIIKFQEDIDCLSAWSVKWKFSISKCYILHLRHSHSYGDYFYMKIQLHLDWVSDIINDLGVIVDSSWKFRDHVNRTFTKANHILGLINRSFLYRELEMIIKLYKINLWIDPNLGMVTQFGGYI